MINILIAVNVNYYNAAKTMLTSVLENTEEDVTVYFLYNEFPDQLMSEFSTYLQSRYHTKLISIQVDEKQFEQCPIGYHFSIETYFRLLAPSLLPEQVDRILWLDADMIIHKDIASFYHQNFDDKCIVACRSINQNPESLIDKLGLPTETVYFNAGIILFDIHKIRKEYPVNVFFDYIKNNIEKITWLDQDVLNAVFYDSKKIADFNIYNYQLFVNTKIRKEERVSLNEQVCVYHYLGKAKPWMPRYYNVLGKEYRYYMRRSEGTLKWITFNIKRGIVSTLYKMYSVCK